MTKYFSDLDKSTQIEIFNGFGKVLIGSEDFIKNKELKRLSREYLLLLRKWKEWKCQFVGSEDSHLRSAAEHCGQDSQYAKELEYRQDRVKMKNLAEAMDIAKEQKG
jgi:hypothetical protein